MTSREFNFDGLVGPTHNYSGLSFGNVASTSHKARPSNPRQAAFQGLCKMKMLHDLGLAQALLPPHERPNLSMLRRLGFSGNEKQIIERVAKTAPSLLRSLSSASPMWTANAATVAPSADTRDGKVHFTPANLNNKFHRSYEHETTGRILGAIFRDENYFVHHSALPSGPWLGDEGAANHTRLSHSHAEPGVHLFVYGKSAFGESKLFPKKFPARQTLEASEAVARLNQVEHRSIFLQQSPQLIDQGVFHNDVAAVGNENVFFAHEEAYVGGKAALKALQRQFKKLTAEALQVVMVPKKAVSVKDAVKSYLFNTQLVTLEDGSMSLIAPTECAATRSVKNYLTQLVADKSQPIRQVHYLDLRQSMSNGGGPACLRLRVVLTDKEEQHVHRGVIFTAGLFEKLTAWVEKHYRDKLLPKEIADPLLWEESCRALDELTQILDLGSLYDFQR